MPSEEIAGGQSEVDHLRMCMEIATGQMAGLEAEVERLREEVKLLRLEIKEGCDAARNFGGEVVGDDDEPKWCVAAAVVADRKRR